MKKGIIALSIMFSVLFVSIFSFAYVSAYDDTVVTDKTSFSIGGSCTLSATFRRLSSGTVVAMQQKYIKSPKSGYTIYTKDINTYKKNNRIHVTGSCAQSTKTPSEGSYIDLHVSHPY